MSELEQQIEELEAEIDKQTDKLQELRDKLIVDKFDGINLEGKYLHHKRYGYMYIYLQTESFVTDKSVLLRCVNFRSCSGFLEDNYFKFSDAEDIRIKVDDFVKEVKEGMFKEIRKDAFLSAFKKNTFCLYDSMKYVLSNFKNERSKEHS